MATTTTTTDNDEEISSKLLKSLSTTKYACSSLERLGGYSAFVYRGILLRPLTNGAGTIIIKHTASYAARLELQLPEDRVQARENEVLLLLARNPNAVPAVTVKSLTARTTDIYDFLPQEKAVLMEDIPGCITLRQFLTTFSWRHLLAPAGSALGFSLGAWLGNFHSSTHTLDRADLPQIVNGRDSARRFLLGFNTKNLQQNLEAYPGVLRTDEARVRAAVAAELQRDHGRDLGITHGDFHMMNVLLSFGLLSSTIVPIDWESCHFGCQTLDFARIITNLYVVDRAGGINAPRSILRGFIDGYHETRHLDDELVWRTVVGVGLLVLCTPYRITLPGRDVRGILQEGEDLLIKGLAEDREWVKTSVLAGLLDKI
ncbi:hypothetical protein BO86DRAFT_440691 [Aspergillus japonicus CBS 114.51]|uniref:Aminoglycoside phosphotransferase domain-containing protein n=1 Tax=Aspergillus japonicus CBS 114.51 TaxID=1448312 RepID=A0A8T8WP72_ASPJA|nr:hypothetical protein BO86DRAFT_440691 [Aspergillus japonicus CBS 114.51]RAH77596.1 hypothetical protein BO86DRAFT_440691 [Aspergillus japonicus CBS 114.51]